MKLTTLTLPQHVAMKNSKAISKLLKKHGASDNATAVYDGEHIAIQYQLPKKWSKKQVAKFLDDVFQL